MGKTTAKAKADKSDWQKNVTGSASSVVKSATGWTNIAKVMSVVLCDVDGGESKRTNEDEASMPAGAMLTLSHRREHRVYLCRAVQQSIST